MSEETKRTKTVGAIASDLMIKSPESTDPIEIEKEMQKEYIQHLIETAQTGKEFCDTDFYVVVITKKEPLMQNVMRNYFYWRHSCPTPDYDQAVYCYRQKEEDLAFLWVIPSKDTCELLRDNALLVASEERALRDFVLAFADGSLYRYAKQLNGEISLESPLIG